MEIAAYPVPYAMPAFPQSTDARPARAVNSGLPSRKDGSNTPDERVLHGEVLNNSRGQSASESATSYTFEQQARRARPDLSALDASSRQAIQSYLDHDELANQLLYSRTLIDEYV